MRNSNDAIKNRTRDLPTCSTVPQSTAPPRAPYVIRHDANEYKLLQILCHVNHVAKRLKKELVMLTFILLGWVFKF